MDIHLKVQFDWVVMHYLTHVYVLKHRFLNCFRKKCFDLKWNLV